MQMSHNGNAFLTTENDARGEGGDGQGDVDGLVRSVHRATQAGGRGCGGRADGERVEDDNHEPAQSQVRVHSLKHYTLDPAYNAYKELGCYEHPAITSNFFLRREHF